MRHLYFGFSTFALRVLLCFAADEDIRYDNKPCKGIDEELLYSHRNMVPIEHPWIAHLVFEDDGSGTTYAFGRKRDRFCLGVLITENHVLTLAECVWHQFDEIQPVSVELGIWNMTLKSNEWSCNFEGFCVPPTETHFLKDIAVHPEYNSVTSNNNIAILTLESTVDVTDFIKPICQRPQSLANESNIGQYFYVGGLHRISGLKIKTPVRVISPSECRRANPIGINVGIANIFCGIPDYANWYDMGSPLVGVNVINNEPSSFFLVGLRFQVGMSDDVFYNSFLDVRAFKSWIQLNIGAIEI